jgi:hypothetical protein
LYLFAAVWEECQVVSKVKIVQLVLKCPLHPVLVVVLRPTQEFFFTCMETSPLPVKGCKIYAYAWRSRPLCTKGSLSCHTCYDTGPLFFRSHPKDSPIQSPVTTQRGCAGFILTRILTGLHSVASYDTQGDAADIFSPGSSLHSFLLAFCSGLHNPIYH